MIALSNHLGVGRNLQSPGLKMPEQRRENGCTVPRRNRRRIVGKWERIEREAREDELRELERELHGRNRGRKPKRQQADAPRREAPREDSSDSTGSDG